MKNTDFTPPTTKYGFSEYHDAVLDYCIAHYGTCPFGCVKDGAPNCNYNAVRIDCHPAKVVTGQRLQERPYTAPFGMDE